jgi:hypothetical protein
VQQAIGELLNAVRMLSQRNKPPIGIDCIVQTGSYDPVSRTISAQEMVSAAELDETGVPQDDPVVYQNVAISSDWASEYGPRGGERCTLFPVEGGGFRAIFDKEQDDSLQTPSGEWWIAHKNVNGTIDAFVKLTNDSVNAGDGLASITALAGALLFIATQGGLVLRADDSLGYIEAGAAGLDPSLDAVATVRYVQQYVTEVFNTHTHAGVQTGSGVSGAPVQTMMFEGSAKVKAAP